MIALWSLTCLWRAPLFCPTATLSLYTGWLPKRKSSCLRTKRLLVCCSLPGFAVWYQAGCRGCSANDVSKRLLNCNHRNLISFSGDAEVENVVFGKMKQKDLVVLLSVSANVASRHTSFVGVDKVTIVQLQFLFQKISSGDRSAAVVVRQQTHWLNICSAATSRGFFTGASGEGERTDCHQTSTHRNKRACAFVQTTCKFGGVWVPMRNEDRASSDAIARFCSFKEYLSETAVCCSAGRLFVALAAEDTSMTTKHSSQVHESERISLGINATCTVHTH